MQHFQDVIYQDIVERCYLHITHESGIRNICNGKVYERGFVCYNVHL